MKLFDSRENRIRCGRCNTEFDLNKNDCCPWCGLRKSDSNTVLGSNKTEGKKDIGMYLAIPKDRKLKSEKPRKNYETETVGSWGMFNSFFPGKAVLRILANMLDEKKAEIIPLDELLTQTNQVFKVHGFAKLRGFPNNPDKENSIGRLVHHFIATFHNMGLLTVNVNENNQGYVWNEPWTTINIGLTKEGLEFAKIKNKVFDEHEDMQILTKEEKEWLCNYLKKIDSQGYKEYSLLLEVFKFIKQGHNGKDELWNWFTQNSTFINYVKEWSKKAKDSRAFEKQIENLAPTFAASKVALLRELGVIRNKRNDYTLNGELK